MGLFSGKGSNASSGGREGGMTLIGAEAYFHGILTVKGSLRVDGVVEGDISEALSVEVGKGGRIKGNVAAETLSVAGEVLGDVVASRHVELMASARLKGKIRSPKLRIEDGAFFDGQCFMSSDEKSQPARSQKARSDVDELLYPSDKP